MPAYFKVRSCPFCDSAPRLTKIESGILIECTNDSCCAVIRAEVGNPVSYTQIEDLVRRWNHRPGEDAITVVLSEIFNVWSNTYVLDADALKIYDKAKSVLAAHPFMTWIH